MSEKTEIIITARDDTRAAFAAVSGSLDKLKSSAIGLGPVFGGLSALLSVSAFKGAIEGAISFAAALDDMAETTGATVESLSALAGVAKIGGHDLGQVEGGLVKLAKALHSTDDESKGAGAALKAVGLSLNDLKTKDTAEAMLDVAKALDQFRDGSGKTAFAVALLGKNGAALLPFLKDLAEKSELVGKVTSEQAAQAEQYEKNMKKLEAQMSATGKAIALDLLPSLTQLSADMVQSAQEGNKLWAILLGIAGIGKIPIDIVFGSTKIDVGYAAQVKELETKLAGLQAKLKDAEQPGGLLGRWVFGKPEDIKREIAIVEANLATLRAHAKELDVKKPGEAVKPAVPLAPPKEDEPKGRGAKVQADEAERLLKTLREQAAVQAVDLETTGKMTAVEKEAAKVKYQLESGTLKATAAQRAEILATLEKLGVNEKALAAQAEFTRELEAAEAANVKSQQAMLGQIAAVEKANELYGLSASQINAVTQAHLEDAIALESLNGAYPEHIAFLEKDLEMQKKLGAAQEEGDLKALIAGTKSAQEAAQAAKVATLDRALAAGRINQKTYQEALDSLKGEVGEIGEFAKQAARNAQDALADFFINPTKNGIQGIAKTFGETVQKMIAQAASAQLFKKLLGDKFDKTGELGGWLGDLLKGVKGGGGKAAGGAGAGAAGAAGILPGEWDWMDDYMKDFKINMAGVFESMSETFGGLADGLGDVLSSALKSLSSIDFGGIGTSLAGLFGFANGGIMTSAGPLPLKSYSMGGIANSPQLSLFGEGRTPEAYVPLPDGRRIPVAMQGGNAPNITVHVNSTTGDPAEIRRSAAAGARTALGLMSGARRYG